jgi:hypothetical protein
VVPDCTDHIIMQMRGVGRFILENRTSRGRNSFVEIGNLSAC